MSMLQDFTLPALLHLTTAAWQSKPLHCPRTQIASLLLQGFILSALLYLTAKRPRAWVWVLNITFFC